MKTDKIIPTRVWKRQPRARQAHAPRTQHRPHRRMPPFSPKQTGRGGWERKIENDRERSKWTARPCLDQRLQHEATVASFVKYYKTQVFLTKWENQLCMENLCPYCDKRHIHSIEKRELKDEGYCIIFMKLAFNPFVLGHPPNILFIKYTINISYIGKYYFKTIIKSGRGGVSTLIIK